MWWHPPAIPALGRYGQEVRSSSHSQLHSKFKVSLECTGDLAFKTKKQKKYYIFNNINFILSGINCIEYILETTNKDAFFPVFLNSFKIIINSQDLS